MTATPHPGFGVEQSCELLAVLQQLCAELQAAYLALADNTLTRFRDHTSRLGELSASLRRLQRQAPAALELGDSSETAASALAERILAERYRLAEISYRLSALLRRNRRSVGLLARHYRTMFPAVSASDGCAPKLRTWSAEV